jgi:osmotically-inducible protein OsmY
VENHGLHRVALMAATAVLLTGTLGFAADDAEIQRKVEARFQEENIAQEADVRVDVQDGEVTLTGVATNLPVSREAQKLARKETKKVDNQIRVHIEEPVAEVDLKEGIRRAILGYPYYEIFDYVEFGVSDGAILLLGSVNQPQKRTIIENRVARVPGVRAIQNDIKVQSFTRFDREIRASIARQIYGGTRFVQYTNRVHSPIRILVDNGHVTLAGWVHSEVDKALLGIIARSTQSFTVKNELHVDGELPEGDKKKGSSRS